ncbi:MAG TPA: hypothetical protein VFI84_03545 [Candidatus Saccharimonadales bacterium]|nr:hypothetical protein [Candidatus Saccharimonadales bacterium]
MNLLRLLVSLTPYHGYTASRLPSVVCAIGVLTMFVYIVRVWYGPRTAWYGLLMLAAAPWFLHMGRLATNDILYPLALLVLLVYTTEAQQPHKRWFFLMTPILFSLILYIPGMVWLVALCALWYREDFAAMWASASSSLRAQWLMLWPVMLSLLGYALWNTPKLTLDWAGLPHSLPGPLNVLRHFGGVWAHIFARGPQDPTMGLGYLPLLNLFITVMFVTGACFYIIHWRANRSRLLLCIVLLSATLIALAGPVSVSILLPLVFALVAGGLGYLMHEWFKTFPHNPFARTLGYVLILSVLGFSTIYNLRQYFVAWPRADTTKATFIHRL